MIYVLAGGGQGKGPVKKGTIVVTYPAGATCTVTNGSDTYTALDTSGAAAFIVEPGTWTAKAVNGSLSVSKSVTVTAGGWVEVELMFELVLYQNGVWETSVTGGWESSTVRYKQVGGQNVGRGLLVTQNTDGTATIAQGGDSNGHSGSYNTINKIDLSNYSKLIFTGVTHGYTSENSGICFATQKADFLINYAVVNKVLTEGYDKVYDNETLFDLTYINEPAYFCIGLYDGMQIKEVSLLKLVP